MTQVATLCRGPFPLKAGLNLGPTEAAVVLRNGRVTEVRRAGKYRRLFSADRLPKTGQLEALYFHVGEIALTVKVASVPVADDFTVDWAMDIGVRWVGGDDTLKALAERYSAANLTAAVDSELQAGVSSIVRQAATIATHGELQRTTELENLFRAGRRLLDGALEIIAIRRATPTYDAVALAEVEERKQHQLNKARAGRAHELAVGGAESQRVLRVLEAETTATVTGIEDAARGRIAAAVARELGVPAWWVYNPSAYTAEISANRDLLVELLGKHGTEFGMLAEQLGLKREDILGMFAGFQSGVLEVVQARPAQISHDSVIDGTVARADDPNSPRFANSDVVLGVLADLGHQQDIAGTALHVADHRAMAIIVAAEIGSLRARVEDIVRGISTQVGVEATELVVAPYKVRIGDQLESIVSSVAAEAGMSPAIEARRESDCGYILTSPSYELMALEPWRPAVERTFEPQLQLRMAVEEE